MEKVFRLDKMRYNTIRGIDFYNEVHNSMADHEGICQITGHIQAVKSHADYAEVLIDGKTFTAEWVFDSRFSPAKFSPQAPAYHYLMQHFLGYVIKTPQPCFNPEQITMFDFRTEQCNDVRFFYILPFDSDRALVEFTLFSSQLLERKAYYKYLNDYIVKDLGIPEYTIEEEEFGVIPMTDYRFSPDDGKRVVYIGTAAGRAKASTGYAFLRIQQHSEAIARQLLLTGSPLGVRPDQRHFQIFDTLLLNIMHRDGGRIREIFEHLFANNPIERVLNFLSERTSALENFQIMASVPPWPFLVSIRNTLLGKSLKK
jgi:lycopene beta-cyclase